MTTDHQSRLRCSEADNPPSALESPARRRMICKILAGTPIILALSARSAYAAVGYGYKS